ncbi:MAG: RNA polymerase factor sigma-54 [Gammaproteobacteria bacterium]|jgi:RNA polymerase sigma-54 factor
MLKPSLQLRTGQQLTMTPQLQQAIRLLQLPVLDLQAEIHTALEENVMLELEEPDVIGDEALEHGEVSDEQRLTDEELEVEYAEISTLGQPDRPAAPQDLRDNRDYPDQSDNNLRDHLLWQLEMNRFSEDENAAGRVIIDAIDDDGYLKADLADLARLLESEAEADEEFLEFVLRRIQRFDPTGVGSRNLSECLLVQLDAMDKDIPGVALAHQIAESFLELVARQQYPTLRKRLTCSPEELDTALGLLRTLHPKPGATIPSTPPEYIIPDVFVRRHEDRWVVEANPGIAPRIRVNDSYAKLVSREKEYETLRSQLQEARWLVKSLEIRNETLIRVASCIVRRQEAFLERGDMAMKPMILKDVAEELGMHESTISRATTAKYMHTPRGVFEFKFFFSSHVSATDGSEVSSTVIRAQIRRLIAEEDAAKPLSDNAIARLLEKSGARVARRTVAKYRESLGIPSSSERRRAATL